MGAIYLDKFILPIEKEEMIVKNIMSKNGGVYGYIDNPYPCGLFGEKGFSEIDFATTTIFYGGNGSGKSTLLNLIASKLQLNRIAPFNSSETFDTYVKECKFRMGYDDEGFQHRIPNGSRIITSDDVFDYMLTVRTNNSEVSENRAEAMEDYGRLKYGKSVKFSGMDDYEELRLQVMARSKSVTRRKFIRKTAGEEVKLNSNGETALAYFDTRLHNDTLYCLDEPENSLSPKLQMELVKIIEEMAHYCGCQFIIATHSPFLLAMESAKIYDLDADPVEVRKWWELENTRTYYEFFNKHRQKFEDYRPQPKKQIDKKEPYSLGLGRALLFQKCTERKISQDTVLWMSRKIKRIRTTEGDKAADEKAEEYVAIIDKYQDESDIIRHIKLGEN